MPSFRHHEPGNLFVKMKVVFPEHIDGDIIPLLEQALPPRNPVDTFPSSVVVEEVDLENLDARQAREAEMQQEASMEDEGEPRVQCANQ